jgi:hypothetical protein
MTETTDLFDVFSPKCPICLMDASHVGYALRTFFKSWIKHQKKVRGAYPTRLIFETAL